MYWCNGCSGGSPLRITQLIITFWSQSWTVQHIASSFLGRSAASHHQHIHSTRLLLGGTTGKNSIVLELKGNGAWNKIRNLSFGRAVNQDTITSLKHKPLLKTTTGRTGINPFMVHFICQIVSVTTDLQWLHGSAFAIIDWVFTVLVSFNSSRIGEKMTFSSSRLQPWCQYQT